MDVHIGRQPVFDHRGRVIGHELLFRDQDVEYAEITSGTAATAQVLLASFLDIGLTQLVGDGLAFVNLPRPYLVNQVVLPVQPGRLVLEVLEDVDHDDEVLDGVRRLRAEGHLIALDDFVWTRETARLLPEVDLVKIDVLQHGDGVPDLVRRCQVHGAQIVAEKVETQEQLRMCRELGVEYYQGYLLQRPEVLRGRSLSPSQTTCLQLIRVLDQPDVSISTITRLVGGDPGLTYRLLRAANAAATGAPRRVTALPEALLMLGFAQLRRWALLMLVAGLPPEAAAGVEAALLRAAMCERLAALVDGVVADEAFVVGLVSSLDDLLGQPLQELLRMLPLAPTTEAALLQHTGPLGEVLACVLAYEAGTPSVPRGSHLPAAAPRTAFVQAVAAATRDAEVVAADAA